MDLLRGKVVIEKNVSEYIIDENVFFYEPSNEDIYDKSFNLRYIFHNTFINTEEEIAICEFKKYCKNKSLKINKTFFENECLRYLYSAQFDFAKAMDLIKGNYEFRISNILPIKEKDVINYINKGVMYWHGRDKKCRPILIINLFNAELLNVENLTNLFFFCFEFFLKYLCIPGKIENYISIIDCSGISISKFPMSTFMKLIEIMNSKYRCRLFRMYIIDAPKLFKTFAKSFLSFAPSYMTKKLKILDNNYAIFLREEILETQLEKKYGGIQEIKNNIYYPFSFYPNCYITRREDEREKKEYIKLNPTNKIDSKIYEYLTLCYSMHLKLVGRDHKEVLKQQNTILNEEINCNNNNKKKKKKRNLSKKDYILNKKFINTMANVEFHIGNNSFLKNNKYINSKNKYIVNIESSHRWIFKIKYLFLSNLAISYLTNRFPFLISQIIIKSNFKSIYDYLEYMKSNTYIKELNQCNYTSSLSHNNVLTLESTHNSLTFNDDEENIRNLNNSVSINSYIDNNQKKEVNNSLSNPRSLNINKKKSKSNDMDINRNLDDIKKKAYSNDIINNQSLNNLKTNELNIYSSCTTIFNIDDKKSSVEKGTLPRNFHKNKYKVFHKAETNSYCKIKATKSLFFDETDKCEKVEYQEGKKYFNSVSLDYNIYKRNNEFKDVTSHIDNEKKENINLKNKDNNNNNKMISSISNFKSINSNGKLNMKKYSIKSILTKSFDYTFSKSKNKSNTSVSTKFSKKTSDRLYSEYKYDDNIYNHVIDSELKNKVSFQSHLSSTTANVTTSNNEELLDEDRKNIIFSKKMSDITNNASSTFDEKKSKKRLNKIKIIGLQFFNKADSRS